VSRINVELGSVTGVSVSKNGTDHLIPCKTVVSAAGAYNTYKKLLGQCDGDTVLFDKAAACFDYSTGPTEQLRQTRSECATRIKAQLPVSDKLEPSCAMVTVFVGMDNVDEDAAKSVPSCNYWIYPNWRHDEGALKYMQSVASASKQAVDDASFVDRMHLPVLFVGSASGDTTVLSTMEQPLFNINLLYQLKTQISNDDIQTSVFSSWLLSRTLPSLMPWSTRTNDHIYRASAVKCTIMQKKSSPIGC
jgi:hypothetical protein